MYPTLGPRFAPGLPKRYGTTTVHTHAATMSQPMPHASTTHQRNNRQYSPFFLINVPPISDPIRNAHVEYEILTLTKKRMIEATTVLICAVLGCALEPRVPMRSIKRICKG